MEKKISKNDFLCLTCGYTDTYRAPSTVHNENVYCWLLSRTIVETIHTAIFFLCNFFLRLTLQTALSNYNFSLAALFWSIFFAVCICVSLPLSDHLVYYYFHGCVHCVKFSLHTLIQTIPIISILMLAFFSATFCNNYKAKRCALFVNLKCFCSIFLRF